MINKIFPAIITVGALLWAATADAAIRCSGGTCFGTTAEWTTLGTPGQVNGIDTTANCQFIGDGSTAFTSLDCLPFAPSGADATVITGTAGFSGNCVEWNADGDIVDAGAACGVGGADWSGDTGWLIDTSADAISSSPWVPPVGNFKVIKGTSSICTLTIDGPTGTVGTGLVVKYLELTNSCGGTLTATINSSDYELGSGLATFEIADGNSQTLVVYTNDAGTTWYAEAYEDLTNRASVTPAAGDLIPCQDVSPTPDTVGACTAQGIADLFAGPLSATAVTQVPREITSSGEIVSTDVGKIIVCNSGSAITIDVDTDAMTWTTASVIYVVNVGAGTCTVQDGTTADMTVRVKTGFTAVFSQYGGGTIIGIDDDEVIVTGGDAS